MGQRWLEGVRSISSTSLKRSILSFTGRQDFKKLPSFNCYQRSISAYFPDMLFPVDCTVLGLQAS